MSMCGFQDFGRRQCFIDILHQLISSGRWSMDKLDSYNMTALIWACESGYLEAVKVLLSKGADFNGGVQMYETALYTASQYGYPEIVKILLENGANVDAGDEDYGTALQIAAVAGHAEVVQVLLKEYGSALHAASLEGHVEIVEMLLKNGADINARNTSHESALHAASRGGYIEIVELLLKDRALDADQADTLYEASGAGSLDVVQYLMKKGAGVNAQGGYYGNALQQASRAGSLSVVLYLVEKGARINAQGGYYRNSLQAASAAGHFQIVEFLVTHGANAASAAGILEGPYIMLHEGPQVYADNTDHVKNMFALLVQRHTKIMEILLRYRADINTQGGCLGNALQAASLGGGIAIINILLEKGANIRGLTSMLKGDIIGTCFKIFLDNKSDDRLYNYPYRSQYDIVQILLKKGADALFKAGADVNAQGSKYSTALYAATKKGYQEIVQMLLSNGAQVGSRESTIQN
ncbi:putative ankyrin repeat protein L25 [Talaromyces pinophilus]|nr:putative ankyrin repeat protein L25 [Talaromyces pinophilus]